MRAAWITGKECLRERLCRPDQLPAPNPEAEMPAYMESFLAHLRLLVGVPFEYLVPDARLLPDESIRFFYLDRSWTDRLVDGTICVGKIGSREQAHHQAHSAPVAQQLDVTERSVRDLQRQRVTFDDLRSGGHTQGPTQTITGFLLRSAAVSGWPHMDVRAFDKALDETFTPADAAAHELVKLRLERLSPSVLLALFQGVPKLVWCEEPHHGVQFGVHETNGQFSVFLRGPDGTALGGSMQIPVRQSHHWVVAVAALRRKLIQQGGGQIAQQTGSAAMAIELLNPPFRQRFENVQNQPPLSGLGGFTADVAVASHVSQPDIQATVQGLVYEHP